MKRLFENWRKHLAEDKNNPDAKSDEEKLKKLRNLFNKEASESEKNAAHSSKLGLDDYIRTVWYPGYRYVILGLDPDEEDNS